MDKKAKNNGLFIRILLLAFFILIVNSWTVYHFGKELKEITIANTVIVLYGTINLLLGFTKDEESKFKNILLDGLNVLLQTPVLLSLFISFIIIGSFISSIKVESDSNVTCEITISRSDLNKHKQVSEELSESKSQVLFSKFTIPFGLSYVLNAEGFQQYSFFVYPWIGKKINIDKDLIVSPSIIVRIPPENQMFLLTSKYVVYNNNIKIGEREAAGKGTLIIGKDIQIPNEYLDRWIIELKSIFEEETIVYKTLLTWTNQPLFLPYDLKPYDSLDVQFISRTGIQSSVKFLVTTAIIQEKQMK